MDSQPGRYEFTPSENQTLSKVDRWGGLLAWVLMGSAGLLAIAAILSREAASIGSLIVAAIYFIIGLNLRGAADAMHEVVATTGNDIDHLMTALDKLASALRVMAITLLAGVILFVVSVVMIANWMESLAS
jgi:hypothetical protein